MYATVWRCGFLGCSVWFQRGTTEQTKIVTLITTDFPTFLRLYDFLVDTGSVPGFEAVDKKSNVITSHTIMQRMTREYNPIPPNRQMKLFTPCIADQDFQTTNWAIHMNNIHISYRDKVLFYKLNPLKDFFHSNEHHGLSFQPDAE